MRKDMKEEKNYKLTTEATKRYKNSASEYGNEGANCRIGRQAYEQ